MSMLSILGDQPPANQTLYLLVGTLGSLVLAVGASVFSRGKILGPRRLGPDESPRTILGVLGVGLLGWGVFSLAVGQLFTAKQLQNMTGEVRVVLNLVMSMIVLASLAGATLVVRPQGMERSGAQLTNIPRGILAGILSILIVLPIMIWVEQGTEWAWTSLHFKPHESAHELLLIYGSAHSPMVKALVVVTAVFVAPLAEESFFRGAVQTFLRYALNQPWAAVLLTSLAFALVHPIWSWPEIFFLGVCLGYLYERTGNLWANVSLHALFNLAAIVIYSRFG
jgi:membrane protease YdiL (CAAX protease family)